MEKKHHSRVACTDSRRLTGSIDLDTALRRDRPNDNRWGYGLGYKPANGSEQAVWIEVHSTPVSDKGAGEGVSFVIPALFVVPTKAGIQTLENLKLSPHRVDYPVTARLFRSPGLR